jgi:hypothetical protein
VNGETKESFESPLEGLLADTPQEDPPADLKQRCLQAVRPADAERAPAGSLWPIVWKSAAGLAAAFVVMVAVVAVMPRPESSRTAVPTIEPTPPPTTSPEATGALREDLATSGDSTYKLHVMYDTQGETPPSGESFTHAPEQAPSGQPAKVLRRTEALGGVRSARVGGRTYVEARPSGVEERAFGRLSSRGAAAPTAPVDAWSIDSSVNGAVARPWRDESGERQKLTRKDLKLGVDSVEEAHQRVASIITKAKGFVDTEEFRVDEHGEGQSVLNARVPVDALDGVIEQLRELGKVLELRGESEDRTQEYYTQGQSIRDLAQREQTLVPKYQNESNRRRKQQLYYDIQSIRQQMRNAKLPLKELSRETHFAYLAVTLTQAEGPRQFLHKVAGSVPTAGAWLAVSAIFWVPVLLVAMLVWRRLAARASHSD